MCRCATGEAAGGVLPQHRPAEYVRAGAHPAAAPLHLAEPAAAGAARQPAQLPGGPRALHHWGPGQSPLKLWWESQKKKKKNFKRHETRRHHTDKRLPPCLWWKSLVCGGWVFAQLETAVTVAYWSAGCHAWDKRCYPKRVLCSSDLLCAMCSLSMALRLLMLCACNHATCLPLLSALPVS